MVGRRQLRGVRKPAPRAADLARELAKDAKFRKQLLSAVGHGRRANDRRRRAMGVGGAIRRLATDKALRRELGHVAGDLRDAYSRLGKTQKRRGRRRSIVVAAGLAAAAAAAPKARRGAREVLRQRRAATPLESLTKEQLYARAQKADIPGRSEMSKDELLRALQSRT